MTASPLAARPDGMPDLSAGNCLPGSASAVPWPHWTSDDPGKLAAAAAECKQCECLAACRDWLTSLPASRRPGGAVAGKIVSWQPSRRSLVILRRPDRARRAGDDVTAHAGLATATATAHDPGTRRERDPVRKREANAVYNAANRDKINARRAVNADARNAARRAARAADPEPLRAAERARAARRRQAG